MLYTTYTYSIWYLEVCWCYAVLLKVGIHTYAEYIICCTLHILYVTLRCAGVMRYCSRLAYIRMRSTYVVQYIHIVYVTLRCAGVMRYCSRFASDSKNTKYSSPSSSTISRTALGGGGGVVHTPYTIHHIPYTIHHTPYAIHRTPYTVHRTPYTVHHTFI